MVAKGSAFPGLAAQAFKSLHHDYSRGPSYIKKKITAELRIVYIMLVLYAWRMQDLQVYVGFHQDKSSLWKMGIKMID